MNIEFQDGCLILTSESVAEYWQLSQASRDFFPREKECDGKKISLSYQLPEQDAARPPAHQDPRGR